MKKTINVKFNYEERVFLKTAPDNVGIITGYLLRPKTVTYGINFGEEEVWHMDIELESATSKIFKVKGFKG